VGDHPCYVQRWGLGVGDAETPRRIADVSRRRAHPRDSFRPRDPGGVPFFGWISGGTGLKKVGSTSGKHINWLVVSNIGLEWGNDGE